MASTVTPTRGAAGAAHGVLSPLSSPGSTGQSPPIGHGDVLGDLSEDTPTTFDEICEQMYRCLPVSTHSGGVLGIRKYANTFVGKDAVDWLVSSGYAESRKEACRLGNRLIVGGYFRHARDAKQPLKDKRTSLYRFCHAYGDDGDRRSQSFSGAIGGGGSSVASSVASSVDSRGSFFRRFMRRSSKSSAAGSPVVDGASSFLDDDRDSVPADGAPALHRAPADPPSLSTSHTLGGRSPPGPAHTNVSGHGRPASMSGSQPAGRPEGPSNHFDVPQFPPGESRGLLAPPSATSPAAVNGSRGLGPATTSLNARPLNGNAQTSQPLPRHGALVATDGREAGVDDHQSHGGHDGARRGGTGVAANGSGGRAGRHGDPDFPASEPSQPLDTTTRHASDAWHAVGDESKQMLRKRVVPRMDSTPSSVGPGSASVAGGSTAGGASGLGALAVSDRRALLRIGDALAFNHAALSRLEERLASVEATVEGRSLFDLITAFVFRDGLGVSEPGGHSDAVRSASFLDVAFVVLRTIAIVAGLLLCGRCMESMLCFVVGRETAGAFLASLVIVVAATFVTSYQFVKARMLPLDNTPHSLGTTQAFASPQPTLTGLDGHPAADDPRHRARFPPSDPLSSGASGPGTGSGSGSGSGPGSGSQHPSARRRIRR